MLKAFLFITLIGFSSTKLSAQQTSCQWQNQFYADPSKGYMTRIIGKTFISADFDPNKINTKTNTPSEIINQFTPMSPEFPKKLINNEQISKGSDFSTPTDDVGAMNVNADLGIQVTMNQLRTNNILTTTVDGIEKPNLVIVSHGHSIAAITELQRMKSSNNQYLFDTSVYAPLGTYKKGDVTPSAITQASQFWGDEMERIKADHKKNNRTSLGGIAVALNGHRGDTEEGRSGNIDPKQMFGEISELKSLMQARGMQKVVVVTEHLVKDPDKVNILPLDVLQKSNFPEFDASNKDLYDYLKEAEKEGIKIVVVSGEQRTSAKHGY